MPRFWDWLRRNVTMPRWSMISSRPLTGMPSRRNTRVSSVRRSRDAKMAESSFFVSVSNHFAAEGEWP